MTPLAWLFAHTPVTADGLFLFDSVISGAVAVFALQYLWRAGGKRGRRR